MSVKSTASVTGIKFAGLDEHIIAFVSDGYAPVKYLVGDAEIDVADLSEVTFTSMNPSVADFASPHSNLLKCKTVGKTTIMCSVTNSATGVTYTDAVPFTVIPKID